jgi:hypothetical protein
MIMGISLAARLKQVKYKIKTVIKANVGANVCVFKSIFSHISFRYEMKAYGEV